MYRYLAGKHLHFPQTILNGTNKQITKISTLNIKTVPEVKHACTYISLELKISRDNEYCECQQSSYNYSRWF